MSIEDELLALYVEVNDLFTAGDFLTVDAKMAAVDVEQTPLAVLLGWLSATLPAHEKLPSRAAFAAAVSRKAERDRGAVEAAELMRGLVPRPMSLEELALKDPDALHALITDPKTDRGVVYCAATCLGLRWTPDKWWPTLRDMLRSERVNIREIAMEAVAGIDVHDGRPDGFTVRDWPRDAQTHREEILVELDRIADATSCLREMATELATDLRTGTHWLDREDAV